MAKEKKEFEHREYERDVKFEENVRFAGGVIGGLAGIVGGCYVSHKFAPDFSCAIGGDIVFGGLFGSVLGCSAGAKITESLVQGTLAVMYAGYQSYEFGKKVIKKIRKRKD